MATPYYNREPAQLAQEVEAARRAGVKPVSVPGDAFAADRERMIFVVMHDGSLAVAPRQRRGEHISHAVLARTDLVLAASEFEVAFDGTAVVVSSLNNMSGHYRPSASSLDVARQAFEVSGIAVRAGAVRTYDWQAP
ncbi:hypothetical protein [Candidatus Poriferisodalis sp.]|uniref:hypothetical protein n=1 Tax=Candidatus Poriferisodalis sp. TaxID=3101277 RepID=UPI003B02AE47